MLKESTKNIIKNNLQADEGLITHVYKDIFKYTTIGIGHLIVPKDYEHMQDGHASIEQIYKWFEEDIDCADKYLSESLITKEWYNALDCKRKAVIVEMVFNIGFSKFIEFKKFINAMRLKDYFTAIVELIDSNAYKQLPNRYKRYAHRLLYGE